MNRARGRSGSHSLSEGGIRKSVLRSVGRKLLMQALQAGCVAAPHCYSSHRVRVKSDRLLGATLLWVGGQLLAVPYMLRVNGRALRTGAWRPLRAGIPVAGVVLLGLLAAALLPEAGPGLAARLWRSA